MLPVQNARRPDARASTHRPLPGSMPLYSSGAYRGNLVARHRLSHTQSIQLVTLYTPARDRLDAIFQAWHRSQSREDGEFLDRASVCRTQLTHAQYGPGQMVG